MNILDEYIENGFTVHDTVDMPPAVEPPTIHAVSADELNAKAFEPLVEPVKGLIVEGLTMLCGASKIGKSWLVLQMCAAVATGTPFLGRQTEPGAVLYLAYEDSERRIQSRLQRQGNAMGGNLQFDTHIITLDGGLLSALDGWIMSNPTAKLIVIDTLQKIRGQIPGRANAYAADYEVMSKLKAFADKHHVAVVVVHHLNKMRDVDDPFDKISGSTGLMGAADSTVLVARKRDEDDATITYVGRDVWGDDFQIRFEDCRWKVCDPAVLERERYESSPAVKAIKLFVTQGTFDGTWACTYGDFREWAAERGFFIGATQTDAHRALERVTDKLALYDGINVQHDKRVGKGRGFRIVMKGGLE